MKELSFALRMRGYLRCIIHKTDDSSMKRNNPPLSRRLNYVIKLTCTLM